MFDAGAAVSRKVGYVHNGRRPIVQRTGQGKVGVDEQRVTVTPATFIRPDDHVSVDGAEELRRFLGIDGSSDLSVGRCSSLVMLEAGCGLAYWRRRCRGLQDQE
ncbi:hypothetical protein [Nocardioides bruguierae]|uniref:hypothetical protein n=1 Tax=Nocardioides bruguierae TaxID=2945102 RepID=UPI0020204412|nr:hypothetical protein [Nocardioides bruguierae]MCL8026979.1 hypothetical protein [Nocardioides bruguierae]